MRFLLNVFGFFFLLSLISCESSNNEINTNMCKILQQAETVYQNPDGERFDADGIDTLQLLPDLINASEFFISTKDYMKAAQISLYIGHAQKETNDKVSAMISFKNAEKYGKISGDSLTIARAQYNIAKMFIDDHAYNDLRNAADNSIIYYGNHYDECAFVLNLIATSYILQKDYTNAELCLKKALDFADKGNSDRAKRKIFNNYSVMYREKGEYELAIDYLRHNIVGASDKDMVLININIGNTHMYNDQYDSAAFYTNKAFELLKTVKTRPETEMSIYFSLYYIAKKQGKFQKALEYHETNAALLYRIQKERGQNNIYNIQRQYDYEALQNRMNQKIIQKQRIILTTSFVLLLVSIMVIGLLARQKSILKEDARIKRELDDTKKELQKSAKPKVVAEELSRQLHLILTANHIAATADDFKAEWKSLVYKINNGKDSLFEATADAIERVYPEMYETIRMKHPDLNETESKVLLLSCSDLTNAEIAEIIGLTVHTINKSRSEIRKKIGHK